MKRENYISTRANVTGFSFANLGLFTGFGDGVISAVYSLILLEIWKTPEIVSIYSAAYFAFGLVIQMIFGEFLRITSKSRLFYSSLLSIVICYIMMSFSIKPGTFVALDFFTEIPLIMIGTLIPLFLADFSKNTSMGQMNGRYHLWLNIGALFSPMIAMSIAGQFGNRSAFFASAMIYLCGLFLFKRYRIVQEEKKIQKLSPRKTLRTVIRMVRSYFRVPSLARAYWINFGYYAMAAMRSLYMPIIVIQSGFSRDTLGLILTLGFLPYILLSEPMSFIAKKFKKKATKGALVFGTIMFSVIALMLFFTKSNTMLILLLLWQVSGAIQDPFHDMVFFQAANKQNQSRFFGIFRTSANFPKVVAPIIGALFIFVFGMTQAIWLAAAIIGILTTFALLSKGNK